MDFCGLPGWPSCMAWFKFQLLPPSLSWKVGHGSIVLVWMYILLSQLLSSVGHCWRQIVNVKGALRSKYDIASNQSFEISKYRTRTWLETVVTIWRVIWSESTQHLASNFPKLTFDFRDFDPISERTNFDVLSPRSKHLNHHALPVRYITIRVPPAART